jgi:hypothetical protein
MAQLFLFSLLVYCNPLGERCHRQWMAVAIFCFTYFGWRFFHNESLPWYHLWVSTWCPPYIMHSEKFKVVKICHNSYLYQGLKKSKLSCGFWYRQTLVKIYLNYLSHKSNNCLLFFRFLLKPACNFLSTEQVFLDFSSFTTPKLKESCNI